MDTASILIPINDKITQTFYYLHVVICMMFHRISVFVLS